MYFKKTYISCRENHYSNESLTSKNFPLSAKEFADCFNFLYRKFMLPDLPQPPGNRFPKI